MKSHLRQISPEEEVAKTFISKSIKGKDKGENSNGSSRSGRRAEWKEKSSILRTAETKLCYAFVVVDFRMSLRVEYMF